MQGEKYYKLNRYLKNSNLGTVRLSLEEIEKIIEFDLPKSARTYIEWWETAGHSQANSWIDAGYFVNNNPIIDGYVIFVKG